MNRTSLAVGVCATTIIASIPALAQGPHSDTVKSFNGTSLAGWHTEGAAEWRAASGEIVGSAANGPGALVLDKNYQDNPGRRDCHESAGERLDSTRPAWACR